VLIAYIELESTWIHDCPGASNGMSMSRKVDGSICRNLIGGMSGTSTCLHRDRVHIPRRDVVH
jgi:hypothetical protein